MLIFTSVLHMRKFMKHYGEWNVPKDYYLCSLNQQSRL